MWAFLAISASLLWAISNIIDKTVLTKWVKNPLVPIIITGGVWSAFGIAAYLINGFSYLSFLNIFLAILTGVLNVSAWLFYFKAMQIQEASRIAPLTNTYQLFVLILGAIFLGEILTPLRYLGIFLLVAGAILLSVKNFSKIIFGKAFWWIILTAVIYAVTSVITKIILNSTDYWTVFGYRCIGIFIGSIPITYFFLGDLIKTVKQYGKRVVVAISASEALTATGILLGTMAMSIGYVTLVSALSSMQSFFVLLFTVLLSVFFPKILKEELSKSIIFLKILAIILIFAGVILIT